MARTAVFVAFMFAALIMAAGCTAGEEGTPVVSIPKDRYIFVDHHVSTSGRLVTGSYPFLFIDFPTYSFDEKTGVLSAWFTGFEVNDSLVIVYGSGASLGGDAGGGASTMLYGGYSLPYSYGSFTAEGLLPDGSLRARYRNESLVLEPGTPWISVTNRTESTDSYVIEMTSTDRLTYFGVFEKADIVGTDGIPFI